MFHSKSVMAYVIAMASVAVIPAGASFAATTITFDFEGAPRETSRQHTVANVTTDDNSISAYMTSISNAAGGSVVTTNGAVVWSNTRSRNNIINEWAGNAGLFLSTFGIDDLRVVSTVPLPHPHGWA